jgi:hypothetical protein
MARAALALTTDQLGKAARVHRNTVRNLEAGGAAVKEGSRILIKRALEDAGATFLEDDGNGSGVRVRLT